MAEPEVPKHENEQETHPGEESAKIRHLKEKAAKCKKEAAMNHEKYLRALADLDNFRKRVARERVQDQRRMVEALTLKILSTVDNLERALEFSKRTDNATPLREGLETIYNQLRATLESEGVKAFDSIGQPFDPHRHEAVLTVESEEHPPHTVTGEIEKGYLINDQLLRPARVVVSKERAQAPEATASPERISDPG